MAKFTIIFAILSITIGAWAYSYLNTSHNFYVYPNDTNEFEVVCYPLSIEVWDDGKPMYYSSDTNDVIGFILGYYDSNMGVVVGFGNCSHFERDSFYAKKVIYQMIEGAGCSKWEGEYLLELY